MVYRRTASRLDRCLHRCYSTDTDLNQDSSELTLPLRRTRLNILTSDIDHVIYSTQLLDATTAAFTAFKLNLNFLP